MANYSNTEAILTGHPASILAADKFIKKYIEDDWLDPSSFIFNDTVKEHSEFSSMEIHDYRKEDTRLTIQGSGRWCSPSAFFVLVAKKFTLELEYHDAESGCDFYHHITLNTDGLKTDDEYDYRSIEKINWQGVDYFEEDLNGWYWEDDNTEPDEDLEELIDYFNLERPDINLYKKV